MTSPDPFVALAAAAPAGRSLPVFPGYCQDVATRTVQITGELVLTGLKYLGVAGSLVVGPVLLLETPGAPVILGNLN